VQIECLPDESIPGVRVHATVQTVGPTGVEMEAIMAVTVSLVTIFDMVKALDKELELGQISVTEKRGGKSGVWLKPGS
jgi:cyclic pyranopterin phosphate synthase